MCKFFFKHFVILTRLVYLTINIPVVCCLKLVYVSHSTVKFKYMIRQDRVGPIKLQDRVGPIKLQDSNHTVAGRK